MTQNKAVHLSSKAISDLEHIYEYSYQQFGEDRADRYIHDSDDAFQLIFKNINVGLSYSEVSLGLRGYCGVDVDVDVAGAQ